MPDEFALALLNEGVVAWNNWREANPSTPVDLSDVALLGADLRSIDLRGCALRSADLTGANLYRARLDGAVVTGSRFVDATLVEASLQDSGLEGADLRAANMLKCNLHGANLAAARLRTAYLGSANLAMANLEGTDCRWARFHKTNLHLANFASARFGNTILACLDLSNTRGLERAVHDAPSTLGVDTLGMSGGAIPSEFLKGLGVSPSLQQSTREPKRRMQSCFISYCAADANFAALLQRELNRRAISHWYAPEHGIPGHVLREQLRQAIAEKDRVILVCSKNSLQESDWVNYELEGTLAEEDRRRQSGRKDWRMIFPVMIDEHLTTWDHQLRRRLLEVLAADFRGAVGPGKRFAARFEKLLDGLAVPDQLL
jgi:uncharacterized protein YjbI with pentapeptide repeats